MEHLITVGTDLLTSRRSIEIAQGHPAVGAVIGVHPHDARTFDEVTLAELRRLATSPAVVGIGETGLDFYRNLSPPDEQERAFLSQLDLAKALGLVLVIHLRDAHQRLFALMEAAGPPERLVFHCFSGGSAEARRALDLGGHLSFAGNLSYKGATDLRDAAAAAPLGRLLVETDAPYLSPVPFRGKPNEPRHVARVGEVLAQVLRREVAEVAEATTTNTRRVFGLPDSG